MYSNHVYKHPHALCSQTRHSGVIPPDEIMGEDWRRQRPRLHESGAACEHALKELLSIHAHTRLALETTLRQSSFSPATLATLRYLLIQISVSMSEKQPLVGELRAVCTSILLYSRYLQSC